MRNKEVPVPSEGSKGIRQSNIELLRIVAMVLIVMGHFAAHSGFGLPEEYTINRLWIELLDICGNISVNVFVLIAGYFRIASHGFRTARQIQLWLQLFFYSMAIYFAFVLWGNAPLALGEIVRRALPISFLQWWFASTYFVLMLFMPILNRLLKSFSQKQYLGFLALLCFCFCLMPTLTAQEFEGNHLLWFITLYTVGGYIRLFGVKTTLSAAKLIALSAFAVLLTYSSVILLGLLGRNNVYLRYHRFYFYDINRVPLLVISVLLFLGFSRLRMKPNRIINTIASAMFGVYLIHDHSYIRYFLWLDLFQNRDHITDPLLILRSMGEVIAVLVCASLIELARIHLLEKRYMPAVQRLARKIDRKIQSRFLTPER